MCDWKIGLPLDYVSELMIAFQTQPRKGNKGKQLLNHFNVYQPREYQLIHHQKRLQ